MGANQADVSALDTTCGALDCDTDMKIIENPSDLSLFQATQMGHLAALIYLDNHIPKMKDNASLNKDWSNSSKE